MGVATTLAAEGPVTASGILAGVLATLGSLAMSPGGVVVVLLLLLDLGRRLRGVTAHKDPERRFSRVQKAEILRRAAGRCEHHHVLYGRCGEQIRLEADHVHPHSRGGWTNVANGQALCRRHNKAKWARVPSNRELRQLARRRASYFPPGVSARVIRRAPGGTTPPPPPLPPLAAVLTDASRRAVPRPAPAPPLAFVPPVSTTQVRPFSPPREVEVMVDGTWRSGIQHAWRRDGDRWTAEVSWFAGYAVNVGRQVAHVPADRVRLPPRHVPTVT